MIRDSFHKRVRVCGCRDAVHPNFCSLAIFISSDCKPIIIADQGYSDTEFDLIFCNFNMSIYLDFNATTPIDSEVKEEIYSALTNSWANPSSSYDSGKKSKRVIENSRSLVAKMIGASSDEIIFTSGGTESNYMVFHSILKHYTTEVPHIIATNVEHDSIKLPLEALVKEKKVSVTFVPVSKETGIVDVDDIINNIRPSTRLITIMLANNETGMIQPVSQIKSYIKSSIHSKHTLYVHTDAAQAIGKIDVDVEDLNVDYLTIVGHKFYGPRIGALYFRRSCPLYPIFYGGGQERSLRPGTENTCMIAGLGKASELVSRNLKEYSNHMLSMKMYLKDCLEHKFSDNVSLNFRCDDNQLPNTLSVAFKHQEIRGTELLCYINEQTANKLCASTGSACHGGKPSVVLIASGVSETLSLKTLRLSIGRETTKDDIDKAVQILHDAVNALS